MYINSGGSVQVLLGMGGGDHLLRMFFPSLETVQTSRGNASAFKGYWDVGEGSEGSREGQKMNLLQRVAQEFIS